MSRHLMWSTSPADGCTHKFGVPQPTTTATPTTTGVGTCVKRTAMKHKTNRKVNPPKASSCVEKPLDSLVRPENSRLYEAIFCIASEDEEQMSDRTDDLNLSLQSVNERKYFEPNELPTGLKTSTNVTAAASRYRQFCEIGNARKRQQRRK